MSYRRPLRHLLLLLAGLVLAVWTGAARPAVGAPDAAGAVDVTPAAISKIYLPVVAHVLRPPALAPLPSAASFMGANGAPIDGGNSMWPYDGNLAHNDPLRAKSFFWMRRAGLDWFRNYGSDGIVYSWIFVEPTAGVYDWSVWDRLVREAQKQGVTLLPNIGNGVPAWANGSDNWRKPPLDLYAEPMSSTRWYKYVRAMVERYDGDGVQDMPGLKAPLTHWEIWNEPDLRAFFIPPYLPHQFDGSVHDYVRLLRVSYTAAKDADPNALVVGPGVAQWPGNTDRDPWFLWNWGDFVAAGGLNYVDIVSFHRYFTYPPWDTEGVIDRVLDEVDANRGGKPVWLTEGGWPGNPTDNYELKARNLVRSVVIFWSRPFMEKYFWYSFHESETHSGSDHRGFIQTISGGAAKGSEPDPFFHPAFRAAEVMKRVLAPFSAAHHPAPLDVGSLARAYRFSGSGVQVWVAWHRADTGTSNIWLDTGGQTTRVIGLYGENLGTFAGGNLTVGPRPVYLTTNLAWSSSLGTVTGRVRAGDALTAWDNGVAGVSVRLTGPVNATTLTDADGNYIFDNLPGGSYVVRVLNHTTTPATHTVVVGSERAWGRTSFTVVDP